MSRLVLLDVEIFCLVSNNLQMTSCFVVPTFNLFLSSPPRHASAEGCSAGLVRIDVLPGTGYDRV